MALTPLQPTVHHQLRPLVQVGRLEHEVPVLHVIEVMLRPVLRQGRGKRSEAPDQAHQEESLFPTPGHLDTGSEIVDDHGRTASDALGQATDEEVMSEEVEEIVTQKL
jgi:flagellar biosynthesis/type III secretory pathway M-ring protein FliF/YscJ